MLRVRILIKLRARVMASARVMNRDRATVIRELKD